MSEVLPQEGSVLGVDIGYSKRRKSSASCRIDWSQKQISWTIQRFGSSDANRRSALLEAAGDRSILAAALDGPLAPGFAPIGKYRLAERILTRGLWKTIGKPGQSNVPVGKQLNDAANACAVIIRDSLRIAPSRHFVKIDHAAITEAFPSSFLGLMIENPQSIKTERGNRSDLYFERLVESGTLAALMMALLPGRQIYGPIGDVTNHDERAGLISGITALCVAANSFMAVGDEDGWIILPPKAFVQASAFAILEKNAIGTGGLYVSGI